MKKAKKNRKIKINKFFAKQYTEKQYENKILNKLYVPADRKLIESLFIKTSDPKKGTLYTIDTTKVTTKGQAKQLASIAKEIKSQKGRFNLSSIIAALLCVVILVLALIVFRNVIARVIITTVMENSFGAKCDIARIDSDLLHARFEIDDLVVANRSSPMKNLFGIGKFDLAFSMLELTRGKMVAENIEVTGVTWNTDRTKSGALSPAKQKKFEKKQNKAGNPVENTLMAEVGKLKSGVSVDSGIAALKDQYDPVKMFDNEKASLKSPAVIEKIKSTVPDMTKKWEAKNTEVRTQVDKTIADGKKISSLNIASINTAADVQSTLNEIKKASETIQVSLNLAKSTANGINTDAQTVKSLTNEADGALKTDSEHLKNLANTIKSINLDTGKSLVSDVFKTFTVNTLGAYYPYLDKGLAALKTIQSASGSKVTKAVKAESLQNKANAISRLPGRDFVFGDNSAPKLLFKNIALSASDTKAGISGTGSFQNITNDADKINKPVSIELGFTQGKMAETAKGIVDLRTAAQETVNTAFTASGYPLSIPSLGITGVPSVKGSLKADGKIVVDKDGTVRIESALLVTNASLKVESFEPKFLYDAYSVALEPVSNIRLNVKTTISPSGKIDLGVTTDLDKQIGDAMKNQISGQVEKLKASIRSEADKYIAEQKTVYSSEIARFTDVATKSKQAVDDLANYQKTLDTKKAEAEKRLRDLAIEKAAPVTKAATNAGSKALKGLLKK